MLNFVIHLKVISCFFSSFQMAELTKNPWDVDSLEPFTFLKCPECIFDTKETDSFQNHAIENHPLSFVLFNNISKFEEEWTDPLTIKQENNPDIGENWNDEYDSKNSVLLSNSVNVKIEDLETNELEPKYHAEVIKCQHCDYSSHWKGVVRKHELTAHEEFENDPDFSFQKKRIRKRNSTLKKNRGPRGFHPNQCSECEYSFLTEKKLRIHTRKVHKKKSTRGPNRGYKIERKCSYCDEIFLGEKNLQSHFKLVHPGMNPYKCTKCDMTFQIEQSLQGHIAKNICSKHKCDDCNETFLSARILKSHILAVHEGTNHHECPICKIRLSTASTLRKHIEIVHEGKKPHKCTECDHVTSMKTSLEKHMLRKHNIQPKPNQKTMERKCPLCDESFFNKPDLKSHFQFTHPGINPYKCPDPECDKSFMAYDHFNKHFQTVHEKKKPYLCADCGYGADGKAILKKHIDTVHKRIKPHMCTVCGRGFALPYGLYEHMKRHTGTKDHLCKYCDFKSVCSTNLRRHIKTIHLKVRDNICSICGQSFAQRSQLKTHMRGVHKEELKPIKKNPPGSYGPVLKLDES